jgi:hypothetical protein
MAFGRLAALSAGAGVLLLISGVIREIAAGEARGRRETARRYCRSNLKQLSIALEMYCQDWNDHCPPAAGWDRELYPYIKNPGVFVCGGDTRGSGFYALNANIAGRHLPTALRGPGTVAFFETNLTRSTSGGVSLLADPPRHVFGNSYAFLDGSVRRLAQPPDFALGKAAPIANPR